ncbi:MAG: hypothetical protein ABI601_05980 [bacterium]
MTNSQRERMQDFVLDSPIVEGRSAGRCIWLAVMLIAHLGTAQAQPVRPVTTITNLAPTPLAWSVAIGPESGVVRAGSCNRVYLVMKDASGRDIPRNPRGVRVSMQDFDWMTTSTGSAVGEYHGADAWSLCACQAAVVGSVVNVTATYPASIVPAQDRVPGVAFRATIQVPVIKTVGTFDPVGCGGQPLAGGPPPGSSPGTSPPAAPPVGSPPAANCGSGAVPSGNGCIALPVGAPCAGGVANGAGACVAPAPPAVCGIGSSATAMGCAPLPVGAPCATGGIANGAGACVVAGQPSTQPPPNQIVPPPQSSPTTCGGGAVATANGGCQNLPVGAPCAGGIADGAGNCFPPMQIVPPAQSVPPAPPPLLPGGQSTGGTIAGPGSFGGLRGANGTPGPSNPTTFVATQTGESEVTLTWNAVPSVAYYLIGGAGLPNTGMQVTTTRQVLTNVPLGAQSWTIGAFFAGGVSTAGSAFPTTSATLTSACSLPPTSGSAPASVSVLPGTVKGGALTWPLVSTAVAYRVSRRTQFPNGTFTPWMQLGSNCSGAPPYVVVAKGAANYRVPGNSGGILDTTGGAAGYTYEYRVEAIDANGGMGWNTARWTTPILPAIGIRLTSISGATTLAIWPTTSNGNVVPPDEVVVTNDYSSLAVTRVIPPAAPAAWVAITASPGKHTFTVTANWHTNWDGKKTLAASTVTTQQLTIGP